MCERYLPTRLTNCYVSHEKVASSPGHIIEEALPLTDPSDIFGALQAAYVRPLDYHEAIAEIVGCGPLLDVTDSEFKNDADGLSSLVSYLVRSYLYAIAFERGANSFSMAHVLELLGQQRASAILSDVRSQRSALAFALALFSSRS